MSPTEVFFFVGTSHGEQNEPERGASRSRSAGVVAMNVGNLTDGTHRRVERRAAPEVGIERGNDGRDIELTNCLNET
jgi:hypothetical protein